MSWLKKLYSVLTYITFGKAARLGEVIIGALLLGGASEIGDLPKRATGSFGIFLTIVCLICVYLLGIRVGRKTLSPTLNTRLLAGVIALIHTLYISIALLIIYLLRKPLANIELLLQTSPIQLSVLVSILTLSYMVTVLRTTSLSPEQREAKQALTDLLSSINDGACNTEEVKEALAETHRMIPESEFADVKLLREDLSQLHKILDRLDPNSAEEIISKEYISENKQTTQYKRAVKIYKRVCKNISQI
jgi:hypothetical protein